MATDASRSATSPPEIGEVAAKRRPKLDARLKQMRPGLTDKEIGDYRQDGLRTYLGQVWEMRHEKRIRVPRDVDTEELQLVVDRWLWNTLADPEVHGQFPWGKVKPPPSVPHPGYARWFLESAPRFNYPSLEGRQQLWAELLNMAPYNAHCGPFEVMFPGFARALVDKNAIHTLLADLPPGIRMEARAIDEEKPAGLWTLAVSLPTPSEMESQKWSKVRVARMKNELVRCFLVLRLWVSMLHESKQTPLEDFFAVEYARDTGELRRQFVSGSERPASPDAGRFVRGEIPVVPRPDKGDDSDPDEVQRLSRAWNEHNTGDDDLGSFPDEG